MKAGALGIAITFLVLVGCATPAGTLFRTTIAQPPDGSYPLPVALGDQTGVVTGIEQAVGDLGAFPAAFEEPLVQVDPKDPFAVIVTFLTGACDDDAAVSFRRSGSGFALHVDVRDGFMLFGGCPGVALIRGLRIRFSERVEADAIKASANPP